VLGADVAIQSDFGRIAASAVSERAQDGLSELLLGSFERIDAVEGLRIVADLLQLLPHLGGEGLEGLLDGLELSQHPSVLSEERLHDSVRLQLRKGCNQGVVLEGPSRGLGLSLLRVGERKHVCPNILIVLLKKNKEKYLKK
jgi:hypothetical protein